MHTHNKQRCIPTKVLWISIFHLYFRNDRFVIQLGTTEPEQQRLEVFGKGDGSAGGTRSESGVQPAATPQKEGQKQQ